MSTASSIDFGGASTEEADQQVVDGLQGRGQPRLGSGRTTGLAGFRDALDASWSGVQADEVPDPMICFTTVTDLMLRSSRMNLHARAPALMIAPPPPWEQEAILKKPYNFTPFCDDLEAKLEKADEDGERLMQAVVESLVA